MQKRAVSDHMQKCIMDNSPFDNAVKPVYACALRFEAAQRTSGIAVHFFTSFSIVCIINYTFLSGTVNTARAAVLVLFKSRAAPLLRGGSFVRRKRKK